MLFLFDSFSAHEFRNAVLRPVLRTIPMLFFAFALCILALPSPMHAQSSILGVWVGHWENSKGDHGRARWEVNEDSHGRVRGIWDDNPFEGHWEGNMVIFHVHRGNNGCTDYEVRVTFYDQGDAARLYYDADNRCNHDHYSGTEHLHLAD